METLSSSILHLTNLVISIPELNSGMTLYLFGSGLSNPDEREDTDVLLVYPIGRLYDAHELARRLRTIDSSPPVTVIALSHGEEEEMRFIEIAGAEMFWPPWECNT